MEIKKLKLGVIGISEGNGHPYSWSAIFNGYNPLEMESCGFPAIPDYLSKQIYPNDFLTDLAEVTHVWTQDPDASDHIAKASKVRYVVQKPEDLIGKVDAILLARDDAESHLKLSIPFLKAGIPIFIDKPFALSMKDAVEMLKAQVYDEQIFTCSSLRYSHELMLSKNELSDLGQIFYVEGSVMKYWKTYGIHILEPIINQLPNRGRLMSVTPYCSHGIQQVIVKWENCMASLKTTDTTPTAIILTFYGETKKISKVFSDSFSCFRTSLSAFIEQIKTNNQLISRAETLENVEIIERGII